MAPPGCEEDTVGEKGVDGDADGDTVGVVVVPFRSVPLSPGLVVGTPEEVGLAVPLADMHAVREFEAVAHTELDEENVGESEFDTVPLRESVTEVDGVSVGHAGVAVTFGESVRARESVAMPLGEGGAEGEADTHTVRVSVAVAHWVCEEEGEVEGDRVLITLDESEEEEDTVKEAVVERDAEEV